MIHTINLLIKRAVDILGSFWGMIILSPLFFIISLWIKCDSRGPVFFLQERLGKNGEIFKIIKFRTMVVGAQNMGDGIKISGENDSRITKCGHFLRKTSMDELPQLFNVFKGNMSLVGPRPPLPEHPYTYEDYGDRARLRFVMRPGITGLSQVTVRNSVSWDDRIEMDVLYITGFSFWLDIKVLFKTVFQVFKKENIYRPAPPAPDIGMKTVLNREEVNV